MHRKPRITSSAWMPLNRVPQFVTAATKAGMLFGLVIALSTLVTGGCSGGLCPKSTDNAQLVRDAFEAVAAGRIDDLDTYIAPDYVRHSQATPDIQVNSLAVFKDFLRKDREAVPDQKIEVIHIVAQDDLVAFWATYSGTQLGPMGPFPATGKTLQLDMAGVHRIADGKIVETWVIWDNLTALSQLGLFPPPTPEEPQPEPQS
ncbi:MAG: ester cyclase [Thermoanaerobaculales bacterium]